MKSKQYKLRIYQTPAVFQSSHCDEPKTYGNKFYFKPRLSFIAAETLEDLYGKRNWDSFFRHFRINGYQILHTYYDGLVFLDLLFTTEYDMATFAIEHA